MKAIKSLSDRLWARVEKSDTCWLWTGYIKPSGHGQLQRGRRGEGVINAHVAAWELLIGQTADGIVLHHLCGIKPCVNPDHLRPMTRADHLLIHAGDLRIYEPGRLSRAADIGRCSRWHINRGMQCICGTHKEVMRA